MQGKGPKNRRMSGRAPQGGCSAADNKTGKEWLKRLIPVQAARTFEQEHRRENADVPALHSN
jgi:hypothetical protein